MTHSGIWLIITRNTSHSKFTRRLLCYLRTSFLEEIFNGDLLLGFTWLAEFNYFSSSLYWEWMTLSRHYKYINTKFSDTNICRFRKKTLFQVPRYVNAAPLRGFDFNRRITIPSYCPDTRSSTVSLFLLFELLFFITNHIRVYYLSIMILEGGGLLIPSSHWW